MNPNEPAAPEEGSTSSDKIANRLVALGSAAVLTVYAAGYMRTRSAAQRLDSAVRPRVVIPAAPVASGPATAPAPSAEPATPAAPRPAVAANPASHPAASTAAPLSKPRRSSPAAKPSQTAAPALAPTETPPAPAVASVPEATTPVVEPPPAPQPQYMDGAYSGWGRSRRGDIEATVVIEGGRIVSAVISQCWTRWSCSIVEHLRGQVVARQSQEVDYVAGATQSANAFYYAVVEALSKAKCAECALPPLQ